MILKPPSYSRKKLHPESSDHILPWWPTDADFQPLFGLNILCQRPDVRVNFLPLDFFPGEEVFENRCVLPTPLNPLYWPVASKWGNAPNPHKSPTFRGFLGLLAKPPFYGLFGKSLLSPVLFCFICSVELRWSRGAAWPNFPWNDTYKRQQFCNVPNTKVLDRGQWLDN